MVKVDVTMKLDIDGLVCHDIRQNLVELYIVKRAVDNKVVHCHSVLENNRL